MRSSDYRSTGFESVPRMLLVSAASVQVPYAHCRTEMLAPEQRPHICVSDINPSHTLSTALGPSPRRGVRVVDLAGE